MVKSRKVKTSDDQAKISFLVDHIAYEREMLAFCFKKLHETTAGLEWNAFYESFGIHARNIYDFLRNDGTKGTTFRANFYYKSWKSLAYKDFNNVNGFIAHMSLDRLNGEKLNLEKIQKMGAWLDEEFKNWGEKIEENFKDKLNTKDPACPSSLELLNGATRQTACSAVTGSHFSTFHDSKPLIYKTDSSV